jgi:hypothetical protein
MAIAQATIGTGATTVYTSSGESAVTAIFFMNDNASARTLDLHVVKSGDTLAATNKIVKTITIDPADTYVINTEKIILANGDMIQAVASVGSSIHATLSHVDI